MSPRAELDRLGLALDLSPAEAARPFHLRVGPVSVSVFCPDPLRAALVAYFAEALADAPGVDPVTVHLLPGQALAPSRPGSTGRANRARPGARMRWSISTMPAWSARCAAA